MVNTLRTGTFTVSKDYVPDHIDAVLMTLECSSGDIVDNPVLATELLPAEFTITGFLPDATCTATEAPTPGYDQDDSACQADDLSADGGSCTMVNTLRTGTFTVNKTYDDDNETPVTVLAICTGEGDFVENPLTAAPGDPAIFIYTGFIGDPTCTAVESYVPPGYSSDNADCLDDDPLDGSCTIENKVDAAIATFFVTKDFIPDNSMEVEVFISCNDGLPLTNSQVITEDSDGVTFVVTQSTPGNLDCEITEFPVPPGFADSYVAGAVDGVADSMGNIDGCQFEGVIGGDFTCEITNTADDSTYTVTKIWDVIGTGGEQVDEMAYVTIYCDQEILSAPGAYSTGGSDNDWWATFIMYGVSDTATVVVDSTDGIARCYASENVESWVESENLCSDRHAILPGEHYGCTITNTVFFEGIPTLNRYSLALLALLMLGIGAVGFRRFS